MTERASQCILCLAALLMLAGCRGRPHETQPTAEQIVEDLPAVDGSKSSGYPEDLVKRASNDRAREPMAHPIDLSVFAVPLGEVAGYLSTLTGVGVTVLSDDNPETPLHKRPVSITVQNATLADTLEWIMRQVGAQYSWDGTGVTIANGGAHLSGDLVLSVYPLRTMRRLDKPVVGAQDVEAEKQAIFECVKGLLAGYQRIQSGSRLTRAPMGEGFVALCSERAHRRIRQILREVARGNEQLRPLPPRGDTKEIEKKLEQVTFCAYRDEHVLDILKKLSIQTDLNIGLDPRGLAHGEQTRITVNYGKASLKFTLRTIAKLCGLKAYAMEPGRGVWLHGAKRRQSPGRSLWDAGIIRSYYVEPTVKKIGIPKLMALVRQNVAPGEWSGALPAMVYAPTGRLIVFHSRDAHADLPSYLYVLEKAVASGAISDAEQDQ